MRLCNSPDLFQEKMNELFNGLEYIRTYIDDLYDHAKSLDEVQTALLKKISNKVRTID